MQYDISRDKIRGSFLNKTWVKVDEEATKDLEPLYDAIKNNDFTQDNMKNVMEKLSKSGSAPLVKKAFQNPICRQEGQFASKDDLIDFLYDIEHQIFMGIKENAEEFLNKVIPKDIEDADCALNYGILMSYIDFVTYSKIKMFRKVSDHKLEGSLVDLSEEDELKRVLATNNEDNKYFNFNTVSGIKTTYDIPEFDIKDSDKFYDLVKNILESDRDIRRNLISNRTIINIKSLLINGESISDTNYEVKPFVYLMEAISRINRDFGVVVVSYDALQGNLLEVIYWELLVSTFRNDKSGKSYEEKFDSLFKIGDLVVFSGLKADSLITTRNKRKDFKLKGMGLAVVKNIDYSLKEVTLGMIMVLNESNYVFVKEANEVTLRFDEIFPDKPFSKSNISKFELQDKSRILLEGFLYKSLYVVIPSSLVVDLMFPSETQVLEEKLTQMLNPIKKDLRIKRW